MTSPGRFQAKTLLDSQGQIETYEGVDPLTGLPVLIYRFPGSPMPALDELESENIPGVLDSSFDGKEGQIVVAHISKYQPLEGPVPKAQVPLLLLDTSRALKDAAKVGVLHGNIKPERFLYADEHHLLEGYGVRWQPEASVYTARDALDGATYAGDVYAWAKSVEVMSGGALPEALASLIQACQSADPQARPSARQIYETIRSYVRQQQPVKQDSVAPAPAVSPKAPPLAPPPATPPADSQLERPEARTKKGDPFTDYREANGLGDEDFVLVSTDPGRRKGASSTPAPEVPADPGDEDAEAPDPRDSGAGFVRNLPPGATYRNGLEAESLPPAPIKVDAEQEKPIGFRDTSKRRPVLLVILVVALILLAVLIWRGPGSSQGASTPVNHIVTISVEPDNLRGVELFVVSSPPDSQFAPGRQIMNIPGFVNFDREGEWVLRARYLDRVSDDITIRVPQDRRVTVDLTGSPPPQEESPELETGG